MTVTRTRLTSKAATVEKALRMSVGEVWLYLSYPTSVNANYRAVGGRVILSEKYRVWKKLVAQELMLQKAPRIAGPVQIEIILRAPDKRKRDADNSLKSVADALVAYGVIEADDNSIVRRITVTWNNDPGHPCVVNIRPAAF